MMVGDNVCCNTGEIIVFVDAHDVGKQPVVVRQILAPRVGYVFHFACWSTGLLFEDFVVGSGWPPVHSREGFGLDGLEGSRFGLFCCGRHDFSLVVHIFSISYY